MDGKNALDIIHLDFNEAVSILCHTGYC